MTKLIALDDGHGMNTAGKRTPLLPELGREVMENEFNKEVIKYLDVDLRRCGFKTLLTAPTDEDVFLKSRVDKANYANVDALISIHFNAMDGTFKLPNPDGFSIHIYPGSKEGRKLAEHILKYLPLGTTQKNRGIVEQNLYITRMTKMTAVLIENGFMDNPIEARLLLNTLYQKEVSDEVCRGLCSYFNVPYIFETISDWDKKPIDAFVTKRDLLEFTGKLPTTPIPTVTNPRLIRKYNTNIHIFETTKSMRVEMDLGVRNEREKVTKVVRDRLKDGVVLSINCGMFSYVKGSEHNTLYINKGLYHNPPSELTMDFVYYLDGTTEIMNLKKYDQKILSQLQEATYFAIGTSYSLVQEGKINLQNAENFPHANSREPRTQFGWKLDGTFILVVTDGRSDESAGLTAHEQAELMLSLGCYNAVNVDGGGSSIMVLVKNGIIKIVNQLANGVEREVGSMMLVYNKK